MSDDRYVIHPVTSGPSLRPRLAGAGHAQFPTHWNGTSCTAGIRRHAHAKNTPSAEGWVAWDVRERNWVRQTRGRPSQAEARESSRRFRLEAVPWKPPRSPSSLPTSLSTIQPLTILTPPLGHRFDPRPR